MAIFVDRLPIDSATWTAVTPAQLSDVLTISARDASSAILARTNSADADTEWTIMQGAEQVF